MNTILDDLARLNPDAFLFEPRDRYDRCVVAVTRHHTEDRWAEVRPTTEDAPYVAVYDYEALVHAVSEDFGAGEDQEGGWDAAAEWVDFNMAGGWLGPNTPIVVDNADVMEPADMLGSKSSAQKACGFESHRPHPLSSSRG